MIKRSVILVFIVFPFLLNAFCFASHYEGQFNKYRKTRISDKIYYLSGKSYPKIVDAIFKYVEPQFENAVLSIIWKESKFYKNALSNKYWDYHYDYGLMQISSYFWDFDKELIFNEDYNIRIGYSIYSDFFKRKNITVWKSFKYYNGSVEYANAVWKIYNNLTKTFGDNIC